ncbi:MAG: HAD family phosphatase [bacterium]|nr:HAD family phosphatase [bacterium]
MKNYKGYIFDLDGTLVESEELKGLALAETCNLYGRHVTSEIYKKVMGENWDIVTNYFFTEANISPKIHEFNNNFKLKYEQLLNENLSPTDGILLYLKKLSKTGSKLGLVSSAAKWMVNNILTKFEMNNLFEVVIAQEDVTKHKPDPEPYMLALKRLNLRPENVLVFEDSTAGLKAAFNAGCDVIAIKHNFNALNDLSLSQKQIKSFKELL